MELGVRELLHVQTLVFETDRSDTPALLRLLADYLEVCHGTLQAVTFHNEEDESGGYREWIVAYVECPWQS